jgi:mono/diheme cytochrome c family protein
MRDCLKSLPLVLILSLVLPGVAGADSGKDLFEKQCAGCHTIGGGDSGGPDLKGVAAQRSAAWLERVIVEPDKLTLGKDPTQVELVKKYGFEMPNLGISRDDARKIIAYLKGGAPPSGKPAKGATVEAPATAAAAAGAAAPPAEQPPVKPEEIVVTPELVARGKALFSGRKQFSKGGAPCIACHAFSYPGMQSGNLAADLTGLYTRMGEQGVRGVLKSLKFPIMKKAYADRPLTDEEITALIAFTRDAAARKGGGPAPFPLAGVGLFAVFMLGMTLYRRRIR